MINPIEERKRLVQSRIEKSFKDGLNVPEMEELEKAHQVGDMHPNGKYVWTEYKPGKFDWRPRSVNKDTASSGKHAAKYKDGERHPKNPNLVWVASAAGGKGDWRPRSVNKENGTEKKENDSVKDNETVKKPATKKNDFVKKLSSQSSTRVTPNLTARRLRGAELKHIIKTVCLEKTPTDDDIKGFNEKFGTKVGLNNFKSIGSTAKSSPGHVIFYNTKTGETSPSIPKSWVDSSVDEEKINRISNNSTLSINKSLMSDIHIEDVSEAQEILKGIDADNELFEKARHGVYADNAENRRLNRVGQEYGHAAEKKEPTGKQRSSGEQPTVEDHAGKASDEALKRAAADKNADEKVRQAAQKELQKRGGGEDNGDKGDKNKKKDTNLDFLKDKRYTHVESFDFERLKFDDHSCDHVFNITVGSKKDMKKDIDALNEKLGTDIKPEDFKKRTRSQWDGGGTYYELYFNSENGEFDNHIRGEWEKDTNTKKEFDETQAINIINDYESRGVTRGSKKEFKDACNQYGTLSVAKQLCKQSNWHSSDVNSRDMPSNEDELKAATQEIFSMMGVKTDAETDKYLEYNEKNVSWY